MAEVVSGMKFTLPPIARLRSSRICRSASIGLLILVFSASGAFSSEEKKARVSETPLPAELLQPRLQPTRLQPHSQLRPQLLSKPNPVEQQIDRRAKGLAYVDLPMRIRARFDTILTDDLYVSDALARPYVTNTGPSMRTDESLENRVVLTRSLGDRVEIGIVWATRSRVAHLNLFDFERQTFGAMIRIVP